MGSITRNINLIFVYLPAGEKRWFGADGSKFIEILSKRSFPNIKAIVDAYESRGGKRTLREALVQFLIMCPVVNRIL